MWKTSTIDEICNVEYGTRVVRRKDSGTLYPVYGGGGKTFFLDKTNRQDRVIVSRFAMSEQCVRFVKDKFFLNDSGLTLSPKANDLLQKFLDKIIISLNSTIYKIGRGTAQRNLDMKAFRLLKVTYPKSLDEQQRILTKLDTIFENIDKTITVEENKIKYFNSLYGAAVSNKYFSNSAPMVKLIDVAKIKGGKRIPKGKKLTTKITDYPYIRVTDFNDEGSINESSVKYITKEIQREIARYTINSENVYVSIAGTIGKTGVISDKFNNANLTENAAKVILNKECFRDYLYFFTTSNSFKKQIIKQTRTTAQPKLALERLGNIEFPLPKLSFQKEIAKQVSLIREMIKKIIKITNDKIVNCYKLKSAILYSKLQHKKTI